jgi:uncharacterized protein
MRLLVMVSLLVLAPCAWSQEGPRSAPIVFFDIAGPDVAALHAFYADVFGWAVAPTGSFATAARTPLPATFRQDPAEALIYIGVDDITATLDTITERGGSIEFPRFEVPGVVVLGMFRDPAGNRVGLVEMANGEPKVP